MHACMDVCMYVCLYVCMDGWMDVCMDGWMYVWMYVCMHVCMYYLSSNLPVFSAWWLMIVMSLFCSLCCPHYSWLVMTPPQKKKQPTQNNGVEKTSIYKQSALTTEYWILSDLLNLSEGWRVMKTPMDLEILRSFSIQKPRLLAGVDQDHACVSLQPTITTTDLTTNSGQWRNNEHVFELVNNQPTTYYMTKTHGQIIMTTVEDFVLFVLVVAVFVFLFVFFWLLLLLLLLKLAVVAAAAMVMLLVLWLWLLPCFFSLL